MSEIQVLKSKLISFTDMILKVKVRNYLTWLLLYMFLMIFQRMDFIVKKLAVSILLLSNTVLWSHLNLLRPIFLDCQIFKGF